MMQKKKYERFVAVLSGEYQTVATICKKSRLCRATVERYLELPAFDIEKSKFGSVRVFRRVLEANP